jgi:hypothetical protein
VARASDWPLAPGIVLHTCSAEDLVVLKTFAGRDQDWIDVNGILVRQGHSLDWKLILEEIEPLLALSEAPESLERLTQLRRAALP